MFMVTLRSKISTAVGRSRRLLERVNLTPFEFNPVQLYDFTAIRIPQVVGGQQAVMSRSAGDFSPPQANQSDRD